jgi:hypothetical protein
MGSGSVRSNQRNSSRVEGSAGGRPGTDHGVRGLRSGPRHSWGSTRSVWPVPRNASRPRSHSSAPRRCERQGAATGPPGTEGETTPGRYRLPPRFSCEPRADRAPAGAWPSSWAGGMRACVETPPRRPIRASAATLARDSLAPATRERPCRSGGGRAANCVCPAVAGRGSPRCGLLDFRHAAGPEADPVP